MKYRSHSRLLDQNLLITFFPPFDHTGDNSSELVATTTRSKLESVYRNVSLLELPNSFAKLESAVDAIELDLYDVVLALGQSGSDHVVRAEIFAHNYVDARTHSDAD